MLLVRYDKGVEMKKDEMGGAWFMYGTEEKYVQGLERNLEVQRSLQDVGVDGRAI
jgi:hypothetical protein